MASLFKAIGNVFREKRDQAAKKLADPVRDGKFAIEDSKKQIRDHTTTVAQLRAETIKSKRKLIDAQSEKKKYDRFAKKAGERATSKRRIAGNQDDLRAAVEKLQEWTTRCTELSSQIEKNEGVETNLRKQLDAARTKVARAEQNHTTLAARKKGAALRTSLAKASQTFAGQVGLGALDELEDAVLQEEAEAEAFEEMAAPGVDKGLEEKYGSGGSVSTEDMMAKYMKTGV